MQKNEKTETLHNIALENRKILKATGISDVESFDETRIRAMLEGTAFTITGKNLRVESFSKESGELTVKGEIESLNYFKDISGKAGIFARIFR